LADREDISHDSRLMRKRWSRLFYSTYFSLLVFIFRIIGIDGARFRYIDLFWRDVIIIN
jgi:hypothetical protein